MSVLENVSRRVYWYQGGEEDKQALALLNVLIKKPLTATSDEILFLFSFIVCQVMDKDWNRHQ